ncbi:hypothetical protein NN561_016765 [Cricetulus griseus]
MRRSLARGGSQYPGSRRPSPRANPRDAAAGQRRERCERLLDSPGQGGQVPRPTQGLWPQPAPKELVVVRVEGHSASGQPYRDGRSPSGQRGEPVKKRLMSLSQCCRRHIL